MLLGSDLIKVGLAAHRQVPFGPIEAGAGQKFNQKQSYGEWQDPGVERSAQRDFANPGSPRCIDLIVLLHIALQ